MITEGVFPVLATPFDANGLVDHGSFSRLIEFVISSGVDGFVFPGLASEYNMLSIDERHDLIMLAGRVNAGRVQFIVGASGNSEDESAVMIRAGRDAGAIGAMVVTPARLASHSTELIAFYQTLGTLGLPIMLQNAPAPMGSGLSSEAVLDIIARVPAIAWVKEENIPCGQRMSAILAGAPSHLRGVFGGAGGRYITDELARGALGTMPAAELPTAHVALMAAHRRGDQSYVREVYEQMLPILMMQAVFRWRLTKEVLVNLGVIDTAYTRAPGPVLDKHDMAELQQIMSRIARFASRE